jgi:hypothetical protein
MTIITNMIINLYNPNQSDNNNTAIHIECEELEVLMQCQLVKDLHSLYGDVIYIPRRMETHPDYIKLLCSPFPDLDKLLDGRGAELIEQIKTLTLVFSFWGNQKLLDKLAMLFNRKLSTDPLLKKLASNTNDKLHQKLEHKIISQFNLLLK